MGTSRILLNELLVVVTISVILLIPGGAQNAFAVAGDFIDVFVSEESGGLFEPGELVFGPDGNLYVASFSTNEILKYDGNTGAFLGPPFVSGLGGPLGLVFGPDGNLYVSSFNDDVKRFNGASGAFIDVFVSEGSGGLNNPNGLVFGPDGNLYVTSALTNEVLRYNGINGGFIDVFVSAGSGLSFPGELVFGPDGNLYVASLVTHDVKRFNGINGAFIDDFVSAGSGGLDAPSGLVFGPNGNLYVSSRDTDQVLRYNGATGAFIDVFVSAGSGGLDNNRGIVFGPDGNFYVSSGFPANEVLRYDGLFDSDGDGFFTDVDCNDFDDTIFPGALEIPGDTIDQNCDGSDIPLFCGAGTSLAVNECVSIITCGEGTTLNQITFVCERNICEDDEDDDDDDDDDNGDDNGDDNDN